MSLRSNRHSCTSFYFQNLVEFNKNIDFFDYQALLSVKIQSCICLKKVDSPIKFDNDKSNTVGGMSHMKGQTYETDDELVTPIAIFISLKKDKPKVQHHSSSITNRNEEVH